MVKEYDKPVFLIGDLNAAPGSAPMEFLKKEWQFLSDPDQPTSPAVNPRRTIDYILGYTTNGQAYMVHKAKVMDEPVASDHRPLFVDIILEVPTPE